MASSTPALALLRALHSEVDAAVERLMRVHGDALKCVRGCADCCVDELTVFEVEAALIEQEHRALLRASAPHPTGVCAFLDREGGCRIYRERPYVCRTQGLPLRWLEDGSSGQPVEYRDICALNEASLCVTELEPEACWTIGPAEARLAAAQQLFSGGGRHRVRLRDLFARSA